MARAVTLRGSQFFDHVRETLIERWVGAEAVQLAMDVDRSGWTFRCQCRAAQLGDVLIDVFGAGPYRIVRLGPLEFVGRKRR